MSNPEPEVPLPHNAYVDPLLTDMYQLTMAYAYWVGGRHEEAVVFELFHRKNPFKGEFTLFAGLEDALRFVANFRFDAAQVAYVRSIMPDAKPGFFDWLATVDSSAVRVYAMKEGTVCFPRVAMLRLEGPLAVCQLMETTLLNLCNYPTLLATCAVRMKLAAGPSKVLLEFGLRRAQGPDGGMSASKYSYIGGFNGTSNVQAGRYFGMKPAGTHAHSFVSSFIGLQQIKDDALEVAGGGRSVALIELTLAKLKLIEATLGKGPGNTGELAAFISYALAYPTNFLALVDTYDTLSSGCVSFLAVALALLDCGYKPVGIRLDSGDLAQLSKDARAFFKQAADAFALPQLATVMIVASNDINETSLQELNKAGHEIDAFGIGTNLVTCQQQPALGGVFKLVEIEGVARIKISQEVAKVTIPGRKEPYRLYDAAGVHAVDIMCSAGGAGTDEEPVAGKPVLCHDPYKPGVRYTITPSKVERLHTLYWGPKGQGETRSQLLVPFPSLEELRTYAMASMEALSADVKALVAPKKYMVAVTQPLHEFLMKAWSDNVPIPDITGVPK